MLVLSRHTDGSYIQIEVPPSAEVEVIKVYVPRIQRNKARLGFVCKKSIKIIRSEFLETEDQTT